jgi:hypothetical protein
VRELRPVPPHRGGLDDDAVHEPPHPRREVLDVRHAAELPAAERGHEHLGGHRAAHLEGAPENGLIIRRNRASRARREGNGAREAVLPARREGGALGGEEGGGGGRRCGREHRVRPGGGVLEARDGEGTAAAWGGRGWECGAAGGGGGCKGGSAGEWRPLERGFILCSTDFQWLSCLGLPLHVHCHGDANMTCAVDLFKIFN